MTRRKTATLALTALLMGVGGSAALASVEPVSTPPCKAEGLDYRASIPSRDAAFALYTGKVAAQKAASAAYYANRTAALKTALATAISDTAAAKVLLDGKKAESNTLMEARDACIDGVNAAIADALAIKLAAEQQAAAELADAQAQAEAKMREALAAVAEKLRLDEQARLDGILREAEARAIAAAAERQRLAEIADAAALAQAEREKAEAAAAEAARIQAEKDAADEAARVQAAADEAARLAAQKAPVSLCLDHQQYYNSAFSGVLDEYRNLTYVSSTDGSCTGGFAGHYTIVVAADGAAARAKCESVNSYYIGSMNGYEYNSLPADWQLCVS